MSQAAPTAGREGSPALGAKRPWRKVLAAATLAAFAYGSWAAVCNRGHGPLASARAGGVQAALSFLSTAFMVLVLEALFRLGRTPWGGFWIAAVGTSVVGGAVLALTHLAAGTPRVLASITPSLLVGTSFFFLYASRLARASSDGTPGDPK